MSEEENSNQENEKNEEGEENEEKEEKDENDENGEEEEKENEKPEEENEENEEKEEKEENDEKEEKEEKDENEEIKEDEQKEVKKEKVVKNKNKVINKFLEAKLSQSNEIKFDLKGNSNSNMIFGNNYNNNNNSAITAGFPVRSSLQILSDINNDMDLLSNKINQEIMPKSSSTYYQKNLYDFSPLQFQTISNDNMNHFYDKEDLEIKELINKANNLTGNFNYNRNRNRFRYNSNRYNNYSQDLNSRYEKENEFNNEYDLPMDYYPKNQNRNRFHSINGYKKQNGGLYSSYKRNSFDNYNNYNFVEEDLNDDYDYDYYNKENDDERYYLTEMRNNNRPFINNINRLYNEYSRNNGGMKVQSNTYNNRHRFSDIYINNNNRFHEKLNRKLYTPKRQILTYDNDYNNNINNYPAYRDNIIRKQNSYKRFNDRRPNSARDIYMENS